MKYIKKYFPDFLINTGILTFAYYTFLPPEEHQIGLPKLPKFFGTWTDYHANEKLIGIVMLAIGINIILRRYLKD